MNTAPIPSLAVVGRTSAGQPRTLRLTQRERAQRNAGYRRLAAVILGLDVASLAMELQSSHRFTGNLASRRAA